MTAWAYIYMDDDDDDPSCWSLPLINDRCHPSQTVSRPRASVCLFCHNKWTQLRSLCSHRSPTDSSLRRPSTSPLLRSLPFFLLLLLLLPPQNLTTASPPSQERRLYDDLEA
eukprot:GHVU01053789.1.p2 GENE.GHVU01053789.1~~GHVU01053789.1.p2  ORF type:complete len:112 (-),score=23.01 GHVU01053789.1:740-1075(-)